MGTATLRRSARYTTAVGVLLAAAMVTTTVQAAPQAAPAPLRERVAKALGDEKRLSSGLRMWLAGPPAARQPARQAAAMPVFGDNVDANDPARDLAAGQSETAIAAQRGSGGRRLVLAGWNDISAFLVADPTSRVGSGTGVGLSGDGGAHFRDLIGLPNNNADQQWSGDPVVVSLGDGRHFAVSSLYYPSLRACTGTAPAYGTVAVTIATVNAAGTSASFGPPVAVTLPGNLCASSSPDQPADLATLDKDWMAYDRRSRTLSVSYTRLFFPPPPVCDPTGCTFPPGGHSGNGQIEIVRATVPANPATLSARSFGAPAVVWPEEPNCAGGIPSSPASRCGALNQGAYVAVASGGDTYVGWERNIASNVGNGDPYVYVHAARVPARSSAPVVGGTAHPVVVSRGQPHGTSAGGTKSLDTTFIAGYSRGQGQDFPRVAIDVPANRVLFEWNDASVHPLGDIWLRAASLNLGSLARTVRVNDDSGFALHFLPAVTVRPDGTICSSWYDRRRSGPSSTVTDYYAECRPAPGTNATDVRITTGATDWNGTSSAINPNFGDYTDTATDGTRTYFTWSDGRVGVPQPFVASR
jgi:hypothetical protein